MSTTAPTLSAAELPAITLDDVRAAAGRIDGAVVRTPTLKSQTLSELVRADVWLKFENLQFTAAYKERGALNALLLLSEEAKARGAAILGIFHDEAARTRVCDRLVDVTGFTPPSPKAGEAA